jgi:hypothetical protein
MQQPGLVQPLTSNDGFHQPQLQSSSLFWPDSENLLQNIMAIDPALWEQPVPLMPPILENQVSPLGEEIEDDTTNTSAGEGHRAIQTLSALLSNTVGQTLTTI